MKVAWVLGSGGLLGAALCRNLRNDDTQLFIPDHRFSWNDFFSLSPQIAAAVRSFALEVSATDQWEIYWAAGVGTMSSSEESLAPEKRALTLLLELVESETRLMTTLGTIAFASSAGAIYAGSSDEVITENTTPTPTTVYASEKLIQEDLVRRFVSSNAKASALIARISTIYGPGQAAGKQQGLLSHIARSIMRNRPLHIYVPYDTMRDYIDADDAAAMMISTVRTKSVKPRILTKIIASECPTTIAEIISIFKRLSRRMPKIIRSANKLSDLYSRRIQFKSAVLLECPRLPGKRLPVGIAQLMMAEFASYIRNPQDQPR
jgi:UDP-glucose 4-epimerase